MGTNNSAAKARNDGRGEIAAMPGPVGQVESRSAGENRRPRRFAAVDLGSHNCRLLIAEPADTGFRVVDAFSRIVRLGEGVAREARLGEPAMARCLEALRVCANKIRRAKAVDLRCVATEACRSASNGQAFLRRVERETGLRLEAIPNAEEARLALVGCTPLFDAARNRALMFDIGGGSTELIWLALENGRPEMIDYLSIPRGVVNLTERHGESLRETGPFEEVIRLVDEKLVAFCERHRIVEAVGRDEVQMLGTSGTVTTLAGVHFDLDRYDRAAIDGTTLDFDDVRKVSESLRKQACAERATHSCIGVGRADLVLAGCAVLEAIMRRWPIGQLRVADRGLREGILLELMGRTDADGRRAGR